MAVSTNKFEIHCSVYFILTLYIHRSLRLEVDKTSGDMIESGNMIEITEHIFEVVEMKECTIHKTVDMCGWGCMSSFKVILTMSRPQVTLNLI